VKPIFTFRVCQKNNVNNSLILYSCLALSCWSGPAVSPNYSFENVANLEIERTRDHSSLPGSGEMVQSSLTHNFLKYGFDVIEPDIHNPVIHIGSGTQVLRLSCIITEFTDSDVIVVPYRHEDRGYTKTTLNQSSEADKENEKAESSATSSTTTHAGVITQGSHIKYTQSRVGIMLKMRDKNSGSLVWSNSYWYSGLELQRTIDICVRNGIVQIRKLFQ